MRKTVYIIGLCLCASMLMAADTEASKSMHTGKLSLGVGFAPSVAFRTLSLKNLSPSNLNYYDELKKGTYPTYGNTIGFDVSYSFSEMLSFQTGFKYSMKGSRQSRAQNIQHGNQDIAAHFTTINEYHLIDIPIALRIYAGHGRLRFTAGAGVEANILFAETLIMVTRENKSYLRPFSRVYPPAHRGPQIFTMSALASAGIDYKINDKMGMRVEPFIVHQFLPFVKGDVSRYLWNAGINCAYYFGVK